MATSDDERLRELKIILAPHCHGNVCVLEPVTLTVWLSTEYDVVTRARALCAAVKQLDNARRRTHLRLAPDPDPDDEQVVAQLP